MYTWSLLGVAPPSPIAITLYFDIELYYYIFSESHVNQLYQDLSDNLQMNFNHNIFIYLFTDDAYHLQTRKNRFW